jgi:hypothetical protein
MHRENASALAPPEEDALAETVPRPATPVLDGVPLQAVVTRVTMSSAAAAGPTRRHRG